MAATNGPTAVDSDGSWTYGTIAPLTGSVGTPGNALSSVAATFDATAQGIVNNNFRALQDKVNALIAILQANGTLS